MSWFPGADNDNISTIFAVTDRGEFYGALDLKDLITARQDHPMEELIVTSYPYVYVLSRSMTVWND